MVLWHPMSQEPVTHFVWWVILKTVARTFKQCIAGKRGTIVQPTERAVQLLV